MHKSNRRKVVLFGAMFFTLAMVGSVFAQNAGDQGFGIMLGNPTGLSGKYWLDHEWALDGALGADRGEFDVHMDFLWHNDQFLQQHNLLPKDINAKVPVYLGGGARVLFAGNTEFGIRIPAGVSVMPTNTDWEFFGEFAPVLRVTPDVGINADFALGVRYYFRAIHAMGYK